MTSETRTLIELTDIAGIEFECPKCSAKVLYSLEKHYDRLANQCPNCNESWFDSRDAGVHPGTPLVADQVKAVFASLRTVAKHPGIRTRIRLQISGVAKEISN
jgi:hypothetical protein